jgi:hypothetical protein
MMAWILVMREGLSALSNVPVNWHFASECRLTKLYVRMKNDHLIGNDLRGCMQASDLPDQSLNGM